MKIYQIIPTIAYGDAVSNDTLALEQVIKNMGYKTRIYAESIAPPYDTKVALPVDALKNVKEDDIILYHLSTGSRLNFDVADYPCRKIVVYHNITPPHFFEGNNDYIKGVNEWGLEGTAYLSDKVDYCLADSEYNKQDLIAMGYRCPIDVLPIIIPMQDYEKKPDRQIQTTYRDGYTNILFTGRLAPNKKQEDLIAAFYYYNRLYNPKSRLILAGSFKPEEIYYQRLVAYTRRLGLSDVIFTGHIPFNHILAYYGVADVFVCMSEHEGFCVPLVEAMKFHVPVIAYDAAAVAGTLNGSGMLLKDKDPVYIAGCIDRMVTDQSLREAVVQRQALRLQDFAYDRIASRFKQYMMEFMNKKDL